MVFKVFYKAFHCPIHLLPFLFASLKLLTNFETLLIIPFSVIGQCSPVPPTPHWLQGKFAGISLSHAASVMILQNRRRLPVCIFRGKIAAFGSVKRVTGSNFKRTS
jgi:hypothetical protein